MSESVLLRLLLQTMILFFGNPAAEEARLDSPVPSTGTARTAGGAPIFTYKVVRSYPHDPSAFTQGLTVCGSMMYEGLGLHGRSAIRRVDLETGRVVQETELANRFFGEGIACGKDVLVQLTWRSGKAFVYDLHTFELLREFSIQGEGWGITYDGSHYFMSDGTCTLHVIDPETFERVDEITVSHDRGQLRGLNELEYVDGEIYANIWPTDIVARISPHTGAVLGWIDLSGLLDVKSEHRTDVLNGIAYDEDSGRLFVTGKLWPVLYEIEVTP